MKTIIDELSLRGLIYQATPGIEETFRKETVCYFGVDLTGDSLHLGHLLGLLTLKRINNFGHKVILLLGGGTTLIGDPSGKEKERPILPIEVIEANKRKIRKQLERIFDFDKKNVILVDNALWLKDITLIKFLREIGKFVPVNSMLDLEFIKTRLQAKEGISFAEFTYQLLQSYDFLVLFQKYNCQVQIGGSDQLGNIVQGIELIRKKLNQKAYGLVYPLLIDPQTGRKFGKTEAGENIWLDPQKTPPFKLYQFLFNVSDDLTPTLMRYFSFKDLKEIEELENEWQKNKASRILQKSLAEELVELLYGQKEKENVIKLTKLLFETKPEDLNLAEINFLKKFLPYKKDKFNLEKNLIDLGLVHSKNEAKRLIDQKGVKSYFLLKRFYLIKKGKNDFGIIEIS
ncbi:MAG: tyrosine--tRNA ligase [Candidatus Parcubacteria bacterium]|nr:MAG: tyrosine--tRNA ligase [Candidatus Parcubacteria bacterium]